MKANLKNKKLISLLLALVIVITSIFVIVSIPAGAASAEGKEFTADDMYQMSASIPDRDYYTFEAEIYVPSDFGNTKRAYNLIGNWATNESDRDKKEWNIEIHNYGVVRLFHTSGKSIFFHGGDNTQDIATSKSEENVAYLKTLTTDYYSKGTKPAFDIRGYTGTASDPKYVKVTITADTKTGDASLYYNGEHIMTLTGTSALKSRDLTPSTKNPKHIIGGDYRDNNAGAFKGKIKNMAMYSDIRTAEEIKAYADAEIFTVDASDPNLLFAYDLTKVKDGFIQDLSSNHNNANNINWSTDEGRSFTAEDNIGISKIFPEMPRTYEAWIYPTVESNRPGVIFGNYSADSTAIANFEIHSSGKPAIYLKDDSGNTMDTKFNYDIRRNAWAHLVITHETLDDGGARFTCYVDGVKVDSFYTELSYEFNPVNLLRLQAGGDSRSNNAQYFKGRIKNVAIYSDVLTEAEIVSSYKNGVNTNDTSLMANYEFTNSDSATLVKDKTANGIDLIPLQPAFYDNQSPAKDYAYSFAVIGDTQKLVYNDAYNGTNYTSYIYDWIVKNASSKNIKFVMGMGDITDQNGIDKTPDDGTNQTGKEWEIAVAQHKKLYDAGIPYGIIMGNHDKIPELDQYFGNDKNFTEANIGYYNGTSLGNYYLKFTVGETKYMMIGLQYGPDDNILNWAGSVIAANPDYRVIITTHAYMFRDGTTLDINDVVPPRKPTDGNSTKNNGDQIWTKLASQYANVIMVLSGHDPYASIARRQDVGVHGNTVTQFLIDFQGKDSSYKFETGMVAMFYFSEDGKNVQVEYISTYKTLEAQKLDANAKDVIYNSAANQFSFTIPEIKTQSDVECKYGVIPAVYSNEVTYPFVVFDENRTFIGAYGDLGAATAAAKEKGYNGNYYVLMRRDAEQNTKSAGLATIRGSLTIDLGGNTLYKCAVGYVFDMYVNSNSSSATNSAGYDARGVFSVKNGNIVTYDKSHPIACVNYGTSLAKSYSISFVFENIKFTDKAGECHILDAWEDGFASVSTHVSANVLFDNCTFDYSGSASDAEIQMIELTGSNNRDRVIWDVEIRGGKILANGAIGVDTFISRDGNDNSRADKVTFTKGDDGKYLVQVLPKTAAVPDIFEVWTVQDGKSMYFAPDSSDDRSKTYELTADDLSDYVLVTKYGYVFNDQLDPERYPILLFVDGAYYDRYELFAKGDNSTGALAAAKTLTDGSEEGEIGRTVEMLFIGDARATGIFTNFGQILGKVIIDLNGHKLIQDYNKSTNALLQTQAKNWKGMDDATLEIINGELVLQTTLLYFSAYGSGYNTGDGTDKYKNFDITFDNVTFSYKSGSTATTFLGMFTDGGEVFGKAAGYNVTFTDCTFDLTNAPEIDLIMNANDDKTVSENGETATNSIVKVEVVGGSIITANASVNFYETVDNGSSVVFGKNDKGEYTALYIINGNENAEITDTVVTKDGITAVFAKGKLEGNCVKYVLTAKAVDDFSVKSSISLWSNFLYNIYLLKSDALASAVVDEKTVDLSLAEVKELNGVEYYLVTVSLSAKESLRDISLTVTLNTEGKTVDIAYTLSVVKYAASILEDEHSTKEKTLIADMLSYARAAYAYFDTSDAEKIGIVDALLGENYDENNTPDMTAEAKKPASDRGFDDVIIYLGAVPSFRFYLADGYSASDFVFKSGDKVMTATEGTDDEGKAYLEVITYAFRMRDDLSYTVTVGGESYTEFFNIYSYYEFVKEEYKDNPELINLVERLCKYSESAKAYRDFIVEN